MLKLILKLVIDLLLENISKAHIYAYNTLYIFNYYITP